LKAIELPFTKKQCVKGLTAEDLKVGGEKLDDLLVKMKGLSLVVKNKADEIEKFMNEGKKFTKWTLW